MEGIGFIHEKLDIKILILYILNHLPAAVDAQTLSDLVFCDNGIGYFDYSDCLAELVDTAHITEEGGKYRITEKGSRNVREVASSLPYSVRMKADRVTEPIAEQMRRAAMIVAQHTNTPEGGCNVHLSLSDGIGRIVSMQLLAADEAQARTMEHYFKAHAEDVYQTLVRMLTERPANKSQVEISAFGSSEKGKTKSSR